MKNTDKRELISILLESPLYFTLSVTERHALLTRLIKSYFSFHCDQDKGIDVGYEAGWNGIINA